MNFFESLNRLEHSKIYKEWKKDKTNCFLTYGFVMLSDEIKEEWQIGYYNPETDKIVTFTLSDEIIQNPEAEMFKKDAPKILDVKKIKIEYVVALEKANVIQKEKYGAHKPQKTMIIIQNLDVGQIWNITFITNTFKTINIRIDSESGVVIKDEMVELFSFEK